ncbi:MAG: DNA polymerase III subunit beta [Thermodesulfobacteriota bacterium]
MKFTVKKGDMVEVLSRLQGITGRRSGLAITENILIQAHDQKITLMATDLETGFRGEYPAHIDLEGKAALNSRKLYEIIKDFPSENVDFKEIENRWIEIGNQKVQYRIVGMNPDDFPEIPRMEDIEYFGIVSSELIRMIDKTVIILPPSDDKRSHINGVFFEKLSKRKKILRMVSTDGSRLSTVDCELEKDFPFPSEVSILVPKKGLIELKKFLSSEGITQVGFIHNHFVVKKETEYILMRLLEGSFPKYADVINKEGCRDVVINRQMFLMMLKRMSILSSDSYKGVIFNISPGKFTITTTNPDLGESKEEMEIIYDGPQFEAAFNPKFFSELLSVIDDEEILLCIVNEEKPCFVEAKTDKRFISVIMPMRL